MMPSDCVFCNIANGKIKASIVYMALGLVLTFAVIGSDPIPIKFTFEETTDGWLAVPPPTGTELTLSLTDDPAGVKFGKQALMARYSIGERKLSGLAHQVDGLSGTGVRVWIKTDTTTMIVLGLLERDNSGYVYVVNTIPGEWSLVEKPYGEFRLGEDSKDENGQLDLDQVHLLLIVDAGGFLPGAKGERTLWVDEYELTDDIKSDNARIKSYIPLLDTGHPSESGARATRGITYHQGKFGLGVLADSPGELVAVPIKRQVAEDENNTEKWRWSEGTIELWLSPQFDMSEVPDFAGLLTMQYEPFATGFSGSLLIIYTKTRQIAFLMNANMENIIATKPLNWKKGEWHHLAISWGKKGMRIYLDGKEAGKNKYDSGPGTLTEDVVVGNHAWTIMSGKFANTVIDELRLSDKQRTGEEIKASAETPAPLKPDDNTLALEHFDGEPLPPITLKPGDLPFNAVPVGKPVKLEVFLPKQVAVSSLIYAVSTPDGISLREKTIQLAYKTIQLAYLSRNGFSLELEPFQNPGFYKISFWHKKDDEIISKGTDWFRILSQEKDRGEAELFFGASSCYADPQDREEFFRLAATVGVRSVRMPFEWSEIEPKDNKFVWDKYDRIVGWADKYNVELIPTFIWENPQPEWAGRGKKGEEHYPPEDMKKWGDFVYQTVNRYKESVHWWIPANEPNLSKYWHPKPDAKAYVNLLKVTREAVLRAEPKAKILGCNVAGMDLLFLEECFKEGALSYCDAVGVHPYICPHSPDERIPINILNPMSPAGNFRDGLILAKKLIEKYGGKQKLWLDEAGQPYRDDFIIPNWGVSEEKAAEYLVKIYSESLASGAVERVLWFSFWGGEYGSFALLRPDGSPTLPMIAYNALAFQLGGETFEKEQ